MITPKTIFGFLVTYHNGEERLFGFLTRPGAVIARRTYEGMQKSGALSQKIATVGDVSEIPVSEHGRVTMVTGTHLPNRTAELVYNPNYGGMVKPQAVRQPAPVRPQQPAHKSAKVATPAEAAANIPAEPILPDAEAPDFEGDFEPADPSQEATDTAPRKRGRPPKTA